MPIGQINETPRFFGAGDINAVMIVVRNFISNVPFLFAGS